MLVDDAEWNIFPHMKNHMIRERIMSEFLIIMRERNSLRTNNHWIFKKYNSYSYNIISFYIHNVKRNLDEK